MDIEQYTQYQNAQRPSVDPAVRASDFEGNRTLAYGYTTERNTFHVYVEDGQIHRVIFSYPNILIDHVHGEQIEAELLRPDKRVYPEHTDYEFSQVMSSLEFPLPFTTFNAEAESRGAFAGKRRFELV